MAQDDNFEERLARKELLDAFNEVRAVRGEPPLTEFPEPPFCSFCGKGRSETGALVEGLDAHICLLCASEAARLLRNATD